MLNPYFVIAHYLPHQFSIKNSCGEKFYWHREEFSVRLFDQSNYTPCPYQKPSSIELKKWHALDVQAEKEAWALLNDLAQVVPGIPNSNVLRLPEVLNQERCKAFLTYPTRYLESIRADYRAISLSLFEDSLTVLQSSALSVKANSPVHINSTGAHNAFSSKTIEQHVNFQLEPFSVQGLFGCQVTPAEFDESGTTWQVRWLIPDYMGIIQQARALVQDFVTMQQAKGRQVLVTVTYI